MLGNLNLAFLFAYSKYSFSSVKNTLSGRNLIRLDFNDLWNGHIYWAKYIARVITIIERAVGNKIATNNLYSEYCAINVDRRLQATANVVVKARFAIWFPLPYYRHFHLSLVLSWNRIKIEHRLDSLSLVIQWMFKMRNLYFSTEVVLSRDLVLFFLSGARPHSCFRGLPTDRPNDQSASQPTSLLE